ncbi:methylamine utilization protein [Methylophilus methylotrophus]|uniref:methylamine utilization protein n=1 Tax=Methylophilus methylotrophus TaxID=17 RepID=UPI0009DAFD76|nr:methylamine utilization protein [Methylophilus methylotrophus]
MKMAKQMKTCLPGLLSASRKLSTWAAMYVLLVLLAIYLASCSMKHHAPISSANVLSKDHTMILSDHEFVPVDFVPQPGDIITIHNRSDISHSIYVTYPDGTMVNMGVQTPDTIVRWQVPRDAKGEFVLQCWIHPIIRANLLINSSNTYSSVTRTDLPRFTRQEIFDGRQNICSSRSRRA